MFVLLSMKTAIQLTVLSVVLVSSVGPGNAQSAPSARPAAVPGDLFSGSALSGRGKADPRVSTITSGRSDAARKLAAGYPAAQRATMERTFDSLLQVFSKVESAVGIPAGDVAGALAAFAIASFEAYRDVEVDQKHYKPVIDQVRRVLQSHAGFARAGAAEKRELYEHMAILAMFVATKRDAVKKSGDATALRTLREEARRYISQGLNVDPDRLQVGSGGVLYSWYQTYDISGMQMVDNTYVLFKDGTCTTALQDLDPATSRAAHPKKWGHWRKRGKKYEISLAGVAFAVPPSQSIREPARRGERLSGKWSASTGGQVGPDAVYWHNSSVVFSKEGRFEVSSSGGSGGTSGDTTSHSVYSDEGSASSTTNPNFAGGGSRRSRNTSADRTGTYVLDGYILELRFDSGRVEQHLFHARDDRDFIWFRGSDMMKDKK